MAMARSQQLSQNSCLSRFVVKSLIYKYTLLITHRLLHVTPLVHTSSNPCKDSFLTASITATAVPGSMMTKTLRCDFNLLEMDLSTGHQEKVDLNPCQLQELIVNVKFRSTPAPSPSPTSF